jgi:hypothetical protein
MFGELLERILLNYKTVSEAIPYLKNQLKY